MLAIITFLLKMCSPSFALLPLPSGMSWQEPSYSKITRGERSQHQASPSPAGLGTSRLAAADCPYAPVGPGLSAGKRSLARRAPRTRAAGTCARPAAAEGRGMAPSGAAPVAGGVFVVLRHCPAGASLRERLPPDSSPRAASRSPPPSTRRGWRRGNSCLNFACARPHPPVLRGGGGVLPATRREPSFLSQKEEGG